MRRFKVGRLQAGPSRTEHLKLVGAAGVSSRMVRTILSSTASAWTTTLLSTSTALTATKPLRWPNLPKTHSKRLVPGHPQLEAEVVYSATHEGADTAVDFLARRTRLAFLDQESGAGGAP